MSVPSVNAKFKFKTIAKKLINRDCTKNKSKAGTEHENNVSRVNDFN